MISSGRAPYLNNGTSMIILKKTYWVKIFSSFRNFASKNYPPSESAHFTEFPTKPTLDDVTLCDVRKQILQKLCMCKIYEDSKNEVFFEQLLFKKRQSSFFHFSVSFSHVIQRSKSIFCWEFAGMLLCLCVAPRYNYTPGACVNGESRKKAKKRKKMNERRVPLDIGLAMPSESRVVQWQGTSLVRRRFRVRFSLLGIFFSVFFVSQFFRC